MVVAAYLDEKAWDDISGKLPLVLKQCPRPPDLPDAEGKLLPPSRNQQLADEAVLNDARKDKTQVAKRDAITKVLFKGCEPEEAAPLWQVVENCQEHLLKCSKEYIDVNPTFKFIMQHARQMFPQAHVAHWGADTKLWAQETNLIVQHLKALVELVRAFRPEKYVLDDEFELDSLLESDSDEEARAKSKEKEKAQKEEEAEEPWFPPTELDIDDFKEAHQRLQKYGFPIADPDTVFEQLAKAPKEGKGARSPKSPQSPQSPKGRKKSTRKVVGMAVLANWCAHKGYPRVKEEEEEKVEERPRTLWDEALAVRAHPESLWAANNEQALVECMSADEPDVELVKQLLTKPKVNVDAKEDTFGFTPTHFAARLGNHQIGALILDRNPDFVPDKMGNAPLHLAAKGGFNEFVKLLLPRRAALDGKNKNGWTPLTWACSGGHAAVATTLIAAKAAVAMQDVDGRTEAMWAAKHGHSEALAVLLDKGFDLNLSDKFGMAVADHAQDHLELRMTLLEAEQRNQALLSAAQRGNKEDLMQALQDGAYVDAKDEHGWTALVWSMMGCCVDLVIVLAQHSADPNVLNECSEVLDHLHLQGDQVRRALEAALAGGLGAGERLLTAARNNNFQVVKAELDVGAQVNSQTVEQLFTSLIFAAAHCNYQGAVMLINRKANVHLTDLTGWAAMHYAVQSGSLEMVSMLCNNKANLAQATFDGTTTVHLAARGGLGSMVQLLYAGKCELNKANAKGVYPTQEAARWGCAEALQVLICYRASVTVKDNKGRSLLALAVAAGRNEVVNALLRPLPVPVPVVPPESEKAIVTEKGFATHENKELMAKAVLMRRSYMQVLAERESRERKKREDALKAEREAAEKAALQAQLDAAVREDLEKKASRKAKPGRGKAAAKAAAPAPPPPPPPPPEPVVEVKLAPKVVPKELPAAGGPARFTEPDARGRLALHLGALSKRLDTVTLLLELRADVNALDTEGNTPLMLVARTEDRWMVEVLLSFGADVSVVNADGETCFSRASQHMQDYIHKWVQQKRFRGIVEFPLPPSPLQALYRVRVEAIPMLMDHAELERQVLAFFAKLQYEKPLRVIVPANPIHGWPMGFCYADYAEKQQASEVCKVAKVEGIFMNRRRLNFINQGAHYQYKDSSENDAAKEATQDA
ncbi:unnamed protein product [Effrenium voratum]|nr:unnamed protein product [Effrenium voratum]